MGNTVYENFCKFYQADLKIKEIMFGLAPTDMGYGDSALEYSNRLFAGLESIQQLLIDTAGHLYSDISPIIDKWFKRAHDDLVDCGLNTQKLKDFYGASISYMSPKFVDKVNEEISPHNLWRNDMAVISSAKTVNEFVHALHTSLDRNEELSKLIDVSYRAYGSHGNVQLLGTPTYLSVQIYNSITPLLYTNNSRRIGDTNIVAINENEVLCMFRDKGHATTISMRVDENDMALVSYHIPKASNAEMISNLPGVNRKPHNANDYVVGMYEIPSPAIGLSVMELIYNIPTDAHINPKPNVCCDYVDIETILWHGISPESRNDVIRANPIASDLELDIPPNLKRNNEFERHDHEQEFETEICIA